METRIFKNTSVRCWPKIASRVKFVSVSFGRFVSYHYPSNHRGYLQRHSQVLRNTRTIDIGLERPLFSLQLLASDWHIVDSHISTYCHIDYLIMLIRLFSLLFRTNFRVLCSLLKDETMSISCTLSTDWNDSARDSLKLVFNSR